MNYRNIELTARGLLLAVFLGVFGHACGVTTVSAGNTGVRYSNAAGLLQEDLAPGYHLNITGLHRIWELPAHHLFLSYEGDDPLSIRTKDNNTVTVDVSIPYHIKPGHAWKVMRDGNHLREGEGFRFERFAEEAAISVLRRHLAELRSEDFYNTDRRMEVAQAALADLNEKLAAYHLEGSAVLLRSAYFRPAYEEQLATIQLNEQQKLLDEAKRTVADARQAYDNYAQQTVALVAGVEQQWKTKRAGIERAYQVGFVDPQAAVDVGGMRIALGAMDDDARAALVVQAAELLEVEAEAVGTAHLMGVEHIRAETAEYQQRVRAEADGIAGRLEAEGEARVGKVLAGYERQVNQLLGSAAGRAYVAYHAAEKVQFAETLTFQSGEGIPSVLRLGDMAASLMGK